MFAVCDSFVRHFGSRFLTKEELSVDQLVSALQTFGVFENVLVKPNHVTAVYPDGDELCVALHPKKTTVQDLKMQLEREEGVHFTQWQVFADPDSKATSCQQTGTGSSAEQILLKPHTSLADGDRTLVVIQPRPKQQLILEKGEFYDIRDRDGVWSEAVVEEAVGGRARVHCLLLGRAMDEELPLVSDRVAHLRTRTFKGHQYPNYETGQRVDVLSRAGVWKKGSLTDCTNTHVRVRYICTHYASEEEKVVEEWTRQDSRCIACFGEHTQSRLYIEYDLDYFF